MISFDVSRINGIKSSLKNIGPNLSKRFKLIIKLVLLYSDILIIFHRANSVLQPKNGVGNFIDIYEI